MKTTRDKSLEHKKAFLRPKLKKANGHPTVIINDKIKTYSFTGTIITDNPNINLERLEAALARAKARIIQSREFYGKDAGALFREALEANKKK